jgi:alpha-ketoglutarate-dependent taurine dioxygenase
MSLTLSEPRAARQAPVTTAGAWTRDSLATADWLLPIPDDCLSELERALAQLEGDPRPVQQISLDGLALPASAAFMRGVRQRLESGVMFAVLDRLDVAAFSREQLTRAYWLLASLLSRPVEQTYDGTMLFNVRDVGLGTQMKPGSGIRATVTNLDLNFHNDNCFNTVMPDFVGLLCLRSAQSGGISKAVSFHSVYNHLLAHHPQALARLYQPVWWDRHKEFGPGDLPYVANPVFDDEAGHPRARFSIYNIRGGYRIREEEPDSELASALDRVIETLARPDLQCQFTMQPGQIQFVNNRTIGHARTDFVDFEAADAKRHLVRLWLRDWGRVSYEG